MATARAGRFNTFSDPILGGGGCGQNLTPISRYWGTTYIKIIWVGDRAIIGAPNEFLGFHTQSGPEKKCTEYNGEFHVSLLQTVAE